MKFVLRLMSLRRIGSISRGRSTDQALSSDCQAMAAFIAAIIGSFWNTQAAMFDEVFRRS